MRKFNPSITLLIVAVFAYGLLIPQLGFYWDDLPISWIRYQLGPEALTEYFSTNRPVWGLLYQITTRIFPQVPIYWQIFALIWRWLGAVVVWLIARELWKDKPRFAMGVALLFLVYPGFNQQWAAFLYSHFFIVLFFFLFSWYLSLRRKTIPALIFSALNLWMMEYFFVLELARVGLFWTSLRDEFPNPKDRIKPSLKLWTPYLALFVLAVLSRLFIFNNQIYGFSLTEKLKTAPVDTIKRLVDSILFSLQMVTRDAWAQALQLPNPVIEGSITTSYYFVVVLAVISVSILGFLLLPKENPQTNRKGFTEAFWAIGFGVMILLFSGWPFWLIGFYPSLDWPASRFTLSFMLGVSLVTAGMIALIPWQTPRLILIALLLGLSAGKQFLWSNDYRRDWNTQKEMFWQMTWRAPGLKPDTLVLLNEGALDYYADNSLSSALNWIYAPDNHSSHVEYALFFPTTRLRNALPELQPDIPIHYDYLVGEFNGNTSQSLAIYYSPPGCLRVLDPEVERINRLIPEPSLMRYAARISSLDLIVPEPTARMPEIYGPEPEHNWCYYFQKADLARQFGDWEEVVELGDQAFKLDDHPNDPVERFVFIEGYAHAGDWEGAIELSKVSYRVSKEYVGPMLCRLWKRVEAETTGGVGSDALTGEAASKRSAALSEIQSTFACDP